MKVVVIGGGPAGMIAAITAAKEKNEVILVEKKSSLGNKLKITGKGRCNLTFEGDIENFKQNVVENFKFLYSSFSNFTNKNVVEYFNSLGVPTKLERGGRIFPVSDKAEDIVIALKKELNKYNVKVLLNSSIKDIIVENNIVKGVLLQNNKTLECDKCILATGGKSYTSTGSTGDGYVLAKEHGHNVVKIRPGLVPLKSNDDICKKLQGLSLKNVILKISLLPP